MNVTCGPSPEISDEIFWSEFSGKIERLRIPFSGGIALTHRCNLHCLHCYAREKPNPQDNSAPELSTGQWKKIIDDLREAGCLYLLLTGGEPLLRDDFADLYSYTKRKGLLITLFTNGTLITGQMADLFRELPPWQIEISLYGADAATHDRITGVPGSFTRSLQGVEELAARKIKFTLKSILMTLNAHEFPAIEKIAQSYGVDFRMDSSIFPSLAGDRSVLDLRVAPEQAIANEFADPKMVGKWRDFLNRFHAAAEGEDLYACSAGTTTFHIDPYGHLYPCLMVRKLRYSLLHGTFQQGWNEVLSGINETKSDANFKCRGCRQKLLCGFCPGFFELENNSDQIPSAYLCALGKLRFERVNQEISGG
jgi:radical SAM protein with 4Fe4S-binding SPASM domain